MSMTLKYQLGWVKALYHKLDVNPISILLTQLYSLLIYVANIIYSSLILLSIVTSAQVQRDVFVLVHHIYFLKSLKSLISQFQYGTLQFSLACNRF